MVINNRVFWTPWEQRLQTSVSVSSVQIKDVPLPYNGQTSASSSVMTRSFSITLLLLTPAVTVVQERTSPRTDSNSPTRLHPGPHTRTSSSSRPSGPSPAHHPHSCGQTEDREAAVSQLLDQVQDWVLARVRVRVLARVQAQALLCGSS